VTLLHPPYTLWHLSYVAIGAALAPAMKWGLLGWTLLAFLLAMGIGAHALDELHGRPLATRIPHAVLVGLAAASVAAACAIGVVVALRSTLWLLVFVAFGAFVVTAYNLELFGGAFHSDLWFAVAWGAFPAITGAFAQQGTLRWSAVLVAGACAAASAAQRVLSTPVRWLRRDVAGVEGRVVLRDGGAAPLDAAALRAAPERALRLLSAALPLLAAGLVVARLVH
jgi:hypothetical protein